MGLLVDTGQTEAFILNAEKLEINLKEVEPHISVPNSKYGYKKENIYYFDVDMLVEL